MSEHASFLSDNVTFLLDASLGLISIEQNAAMKLFSWAALVFLPPTLIAGIYGMNFEFMPELKWPHGYTFALALILGSAVLPILYLKRRRLDLDDDGRRLERDRRAVFGGSHCCGAAAGQRGISKSQLTSDLDPFRLILRACGGARFGGTAAEIFGVVSHANASLTLLFTRFIAPAR